ncbi:hypothetical protein AeRB84_006689, partial [Aphanomyces euteiches]
MDGSTLHSSEESAEQGQSRTSAVTTLENQHPDPSRNEPVDHELDEYGRTVRRRLSAEDEREMLEAVRHSRRRSAARRDNSPYDLQRRSYNGRRSAARRDNSPYDLQRRSYNGRRSRSRSTSQYRSYLRADQTVSQERRIFELEQIKQTQFVRWNRENNLPGLNFHHWHKAIRCHLVTVNLWNIVNGTEQRPINLDDARLWTSLDRIAVNQLINAVNADIMINIQDQDSSNAIWTTLIKLYNNVKWGTSGLLFIQLAELKMAENGSLDDHLKKFKELNERLTEMGEPLSDKQKTALLLRSMPPSWHNFANIFWSTTNGPTFVEMESNILANQARIKSGQDSRRKEERRQASANASNSHSVAVDLSWKERLQTIEANMAKVVAHLKKKSHRSKSSGTSRESCTYCNKSGHHVTNCFMKQNHDTERAQEKTRTADANASAVDEVSSESNQESPDCDETLEAESSWLAVVTVNAADCHRRSNLSHCQLQWIVDSGATHHICWVKEMFDEIKPTNMMVNLPDDYQVKAD